MSIIAAGTTSGTALVSTGNTDGTLVIQTNGTTPAGEFDSSGNFKFNSGYGSVATAFGCRAWVNFNGTGTVAIRASGNVTSITDNGTGDYTVNFTTAMPDANYSCVALTGESSLVGNPIKIIGARTYATGSVRLRAIDGSNVLVDSDQISVAIFR